MALDHHDATNRRNWDARAAIHAASDAYGLDRYVADPTHLSSVVAADLPRLATSPTGPGPRSATSRRRSTTSRGSSTARPSTSSTPVSAR
jgi:hypothetical protein